MVKRKNILIYTIALVLTAVVIFIALNIRVSVNTMSNEDRAKLDREVLNRADDFMTRLETGDVYEEMYRASMTDDDREKLPVFLNAIKNQCDYSKDKAKLVDTRHIVRDTVRNYQISYNLYLECDSFEFSLFYEYEDSVYLSKYVVSLL